MTAVFVDTSAVLALLNPIDRDHVAARSALERFAASGSSLITTSYALVETYALLGRRMGIAAIKGFRSDLEPLLEIEWIGRDLHEAGLDLLQKRARARLSLVDAVSFVCMRRRKLDIAFALDEDFRKEGFHLVP